MFWFWVVSHHHDVVGLYPRHDGHLVTTTWSFSCMSWWRLELKTLDLGPWRYLKEAMARVSLTPILQHLQLQRTKSIAFCEHFELILVIYCLWRENEDLVEQRIIKQVHIHLFVQILDLCNFPNLHLYECFLLDLSFWD